MIPPPRLSVAAVINSRNLGPTILLTSVPQPIFLRLTRVRDYYALYRLEWPSDLHYSSRGGRRARERDTLLKLAPGQRGERERGGSEARMDDRSRA